ncbi:MAG: hypothetical protein RL693_783 [Verrucomicrobiota bacterium]|jgi:hypothetical protein
MTAGRPNEGRVRLSVHVLPETAKAIISLVDKTDAERNTQGKVIDTQFTDCGEQRKNKRRQKKALP